MRKNLIDDTYIVAFDAQTLASRARSSLPLIFVRRVTVRTMLSIGLLAALICELGAPARAAQTYVVAGRDRFSIGTNDISSDVTYAGTQTLAIVRRGESTRYTARVRYERGDGSATTGATADFIADVARSGTTLDTANHDPDYLTVLNQPFAAELDAATLADLRALRGVVPFDFPSPFSGSSLHGYLGHVASGDIAGRRAIGIRFEAAGTMRGALPDRPALVLHGTIAMHGTAFYDARTALLLSLETTVTIAGNVSNRAARDRVTITYERRIHAAGVP